MIGRRTFLGHFGTGLALLGLRTSGYAQQGKVFRLGVLLPGPPYPFFKDVFLPEMQRLGYIEGRNLVVEYRNVPTEAIPAAARELVQMNVDLIWAGASSAVRAAVDATKEIPIVAVDLESDPVASGFVSSLARPGGNLTGFFLDMPAFSAKRLEVLREALPGLSGVTVLWDPTLDPAPLSTMSAAARKLQLRLLVENIHSVQDVHRAFERVDPKSHAIMMMQSPTLDAYGARIAELGLTYKVPVMAMFAVFVTGGALLGYGPSVFDMAVRSARYVDRVLKGEKPGDLPIQRPVKFDLAVNMKTAKALGVTFGPSILLRADQVIR
jgi:ABC-type uncharacterized transport system substrate-binding protein